MAGLVESFLQSFTGLQEMERLRRRDEEAAAQQAVDNELRRLQLKQRSEAQAQIDEYRDRSLAQRDELNVIREERLAETARHNKELEEASGRTDQRLKDQASKKEETDRSRDFTKLFYDPKAGATRREALGAARYTEQEQAQEFQKELDARTPGIQADRTAAIGQSIAALMGGGAQSVVPKMPTVEDIAREQSIAFLEGSKLREAQFKLREAQEKKTAAQIEQMAVLAKYEEDHQIAKLAKEQSQTMVNKARYEQILSDTKMDKAKFEFDKYIRDGQLDVARANVSLRRLEVEYAANRDRRAVVKEAQDFEKFATLLKSDQQEVYAKAKEQREAAERIQRGAREVKARFKYPKIMGTILDDNSQNELILAEKTLAEYSPEYIKTLKAAEVAAERQRNEADRMFKAAQGIYSKPVTEKGTIDEAAIKRGSLYPYGQKTLPGISGLGIQSSPVPGPGKSKGLMKSVPVQKPGGVYVSPGGIKFKVK